MPESKKSPAQIRTDSIEKANEAAGIRPYGKVVTSAARTRTGLFTTHRVGDTLLFEIPRREMGRDMLLVGRFARASGGSSYGGDEFTERVLRWEREGNRVLLRSMTFELAADSTLPVYQAVFQASYPTIVAAFKVEAYGPDSSAVIDVTPLYTTNVPEFVATRGSFDEKRSFVERVSAFPENVEVEATQTFTPENPPDSERGLSPVPAQSILAHWSMIRLPTRPMMPRLADKRLSYTDVKQTDFGTSQHRSVARSYIRRWRLEKKFPDSALSDPVKPIVYYIDPATPAQWIPWIRKGVEDWQPAFAAAGFRRAIIIRDAPTPAQNPDWSPDDVRNTVVRWLPSTTENADGPDVHDPRSGEILNGSIRVHHNVLNLARNWYITQVAPLDPRARRIPFPDSLMGRLVEYVVAHEVGHTLGFQHNMKASSTYPADSIRSAMWVHRMGHTPTLMDYARFNYVAQPEDHIAVEDLVPRIGPYDLFATRWGYAPVPGARTPDEEKPTLDSWARMQDTVPWYRFSTSGARDSDPGDETEAVGDADAVKSTALGLRNIRRTMPILMSVALRRGEDNSDLSELYDDLVDQWSQELEHVVNIVGGSDSREKYGGQPGPRFTPIASARQRAAIRFLADNAFRTPEYLIDTNLLRRIEPDGTLRRIGAAQARILGGLFDTDRLNRLAEYEALARGRADIYPLGEMLGDVRRAVWRELAAERVTIDPFRRSLQRAWLAQADSRLNPVPAMIISSTPSRGPRARSSTGPNSDVRSLMRGELLDLDTALKLAISHATDRTTRLHIVDARSEIQRILNPER
ncbi:MAG: zinc-dependent metalloprotease [Gemmatimonadaceae bacterium]|nr:zinc-dependent metalloprotease [Gemmatimonadaceae bacterium]